MGTQFSADEMHLLVELAHEAGLPITAHAHSLAAVEESVDAGVDCIEHCSCLTQKGSVLSEELVASIADRDIAISGVHDRRTESIGPWPVAYVTAKCGQ
jgi:imidazolonepropionase-like amidohydrolase